MRYFSILLCWMTSVFYILPIHSQTLCANGKGHEVIAPNGKTYCLGQIGLNWWSAHAWCDAIGMTLVTLAEDCDCSGDTCDISANCSNLKGLVNINTTSGNSDIWTNSFVANDAKQAYYVYTRDGRIVKQTKTTSYPLPLCKPK